MITAHSPKCAEGDSITLLVKFPWLSEEVPFTASPSDTEPHGRELYQRAVAGEFGEIAPYIPEPEPVVVPAVDPLEKLKAFLVANPDVAEVLK